MEVIFHSFSSSEVGMDIVNSIETVLVLDKDFDDDGVKVEAVDDSGSVIVPVLKNDCVFNLRSWRLSTVCSTSPMIFVSVDSYDSEKLIG